MKPCDDDLLVRLGLDAVLAGASLAESASNRRQVVNHKDSLRDIVTEADVLVSDLLMDRLRVGGLPVISEENHVITSELPADFWVVDPIDGSVNFAHGLPHYAISVGLERQGRSELGFVCLPAANELYFTLRKDAALFNGRPFAHVHRPVNDALTAASLSAKGTGAHYELFRLVNESTRGCLRTGSAAVNLCWTAAGKLQAAFGLGAKLWDVSGGLAIAAAAGCRIELRRKAGSLELDYIAGSNEAVGHILEQARHVGLWD